MGDDDEDDDDDDSSWPFGQVKEVGEKDVDDRKEEIGDDKASMFVLETGDESL